jgi:hypothetical protein
MQHVKITRSDYDFDTDRWQTETVSSFLVGPDGIVQVEEGEERIPRRVTVLDIDTGQDVTLESDPERWAELLPGAFRSGDLTATADAVPDLESVLAPAAEREIESATVGSREPALAEAAALQAIRR